MPIYEFRCADCQAVTDYFTRKREIESPPACEKCGSANTTRMISAFAAAIGSESSPDRPFRFNDLSNVGRSMEQRFEQYGMDVPKKAREYIDAARKGDFPGVES